jgi:hypothetical protein
VTAASPLRGARDQLGGRLEERQHLDDALRDDRELGVLRGLDLHAEGLLARRGAGRPGRPEGDCRGGRRTRVERDHVRFDRGPGGRSPDHRDLIALHDLAVVADLERDHGLASGIEAQ